MKKPWKKAAPPLPPVWVSLGDVHDSISDERDFWDNCVLEMLDYEARDAKLAIQVADELLEARKQRFPKL